MTTFAGGVALLLRRDQPTAVDDRVTIDLGACECELETLTGVSLSHLLCLVASILFSSVPFLFPLPFPPIPSNFVSNMFLSILVVIGYILVF